MTEISADVIARASAGDMDAFEKIYRGYSSVVYSLAVGITRNREDAEEAAQDAFVKVFKGLRGFRGGSAIGTWIYRIAVNSALNVYRARRKVGGHKVNLEDAGDIPDARPPEQKEALAGQDAKSALAEVLAGLSEEHRACLVLREVEGMDYKQMSEALKIPVNTVRSRLARARQAVMAYRPKGGAGHGL